MFQSLVSVSNKESQQQELLGAPPLIIADEPTSALDTDSRENFIKTLFNIADKNETTIVFVSHDRGLKQYFDRSISLLEINQIGKIKYDS